MDLASRAAGVTTMAQLSFAELIDRDVPLGAAEAVALTLAAAAAHDAEGDAGALPPLEHVLLSSTGVVTFAAPVSGYEHTEAGWLTSLLCRLLGLDEPEDRARCRGRVPGGLLVLVARMRGQIDLPPLSAGAFRESLARFSADGERAVLAAVFWRAARMRPRQPEWTPTSTELTGTRSSIDRRTRGPSSSELRKWLRQAESELFTLQQCGWLRVGRVAERAVLTARGPAALMLVVAVVTAAGFWAWPVRPARPASALTGDLILPDHSRPSGLIPVALNTAVPGTVLGTSNSGTTTLTSKPSHLARKGQVSKIRRSPAGNGSARTGRTRSGTVRTVRLVNLPRASWVEVQETRRAARAR